MSKSFSVISLFLFSFCLQIKADVNIAVAANFLPIMKDLVKEYKNVSDQNIILSSSSTGGLYSQIINGAPYDLFLAADLERPKKLKSIHKLNSQVKIYAKGKVAFWHMGGVCQAKDLIKNILSSKKMALPNPKVAPYGLVAMSFLKEHNIWDRVTDKLIFGMNVAQS